MCQESCSGQVVFPEATKMAFANPYGTWSGECVSRTGDSCASDLIVLHAVLKKLRRSRNHMLCCSLCSLRTCCRKGNIPYWRRLLLRFWCDVQHVLRLRVRPQAAGFRTGTLLLEQLRSTTFWPNAQFNQSMGPCDGLCVYASWHTAWQELSKISFLSRAWVAFSHH